MTASEYMKIEIEQRQIIDDAERAISEAKGKLKLPKWVGEEARGRRQYPVFDPPLRRATVNDLNPGTALFLIGEGVIACWHRCMFVSVPVGAEGVTWLDADLNEHQLSETYVEVAK